jgi:hypothetical protein
MQQNASHYQQSPMNSYMSGQVSSFPVNNVQTPRNTVPGIIHTPQQFVQMPQSQNALPGNLDISQLVQLVDLARSTGDSGRNVAEQLAVTRAGTKTDPPGRPNF